LELHYYRISPKVVNNNAIYWNTSVAEYRVNNIPAGSIGSSAILIPTGSSMVRLGQMTNNRHAISINMISGRADQDDKDRAADAAVAVLDAAGVKAADAFAEYQRQWAELDEVEGMTGLASIWVEAERAADNALLRVVTMSPADIAVCKSKSKMKEKGPWKDFFEQMAIKSVLHRALSSGAITFDEGLTHALAATPLGAYDGDADEMDLDAPTVRQVAAPDAPRAFQRPAPPSEDVADPASGGGE
jgi:hypothetical protein